jgi:hypothetical protein
MIPHVIEAKYVNDYKVWVRFNDGLSGEIDLSTELDGPIFEPLKDKAYFNQFSVRYNTISWENGADFAPEFLWEKITQQQTPSDWQNAATPLSFVLGGEFSRTQHTKQERRAVMKKAELKNFGTPDEVREFPKGRLELIKVGGATVGRAIFEPGWRWATSVQPIAKTKSCDAPHFQYHVSGVLRIRMDDGTEFDCKPGDVSLLPSGHDAWVVGDEPAVVVDFQGMIDYAKSL